MRPHLWTLFVCALIGTMGLSNRAHAWPKNTHHCGKEPCASPQCTTPQATCPPAEKCAPKEKCPEKKCHFQLIPPHKSCLNFPEHVRPPCIVPPCPAPPPPCLPPVLCLTMPSSGPSAPAPQAPTK
jgi:hypothetical protein